MKNFSLIICALLLLTNAAGCSSENPDGFSKPESTVSPSAPESTQSSEFEISADSEPSNEPTLFIGLDGKPILAGEIAVLENTDKTADMLTPDDINATAYCKGFTYLKEPTGTAYDSYKNPELFENGRYLGELTENTNEWKRVNIGDEICGLTVAWANVTFYINDYENFNFPERYMEYSGKAAPYCEFEGAVEIEGFLQVLPNYVRYKENSRMTVFYPCESKLPVAPGNPDEEKGFVTPIFDGYIFDHSDDFGIVGENGCGGIGLGTLDDQTCDMEGIGRGDIAYARVTLANIKYYGDYISATLESVERLSDILAHDEDQNDEIQPVTPNFFEQLKEELGY